MVWIPDTIGAEGPRPGFWIDACPVTNDEFAGFVAESGYRSEGDWCHPAGPGSSVDGRGDHPVVRVTWADVEAYAAWTGKALPTEPEWEEAARGSLERFGDRGACPVALRPPNDYGLYDMVGSVWQWTNRWCGRYQRFIRGGLRLPDRIPQPVGGSAGDLGFRCVLRLP
jgi:formylglycine-generating enzyme required for sulfatase activity